jgi:autotransporter-associated beta strand protein
MIPPPKKPARSVASTLRRSVFGKLFIGLASFSVFALQSSQAATYVLQNSMVNTSGLVTFDWFTGGPNTPGTWNNTPTSGAGSNADVFQFFTDATTAFSNGAAVTQTANINNGGTARLLGTLSLEGKSSGTSGNDLTMTISGDPLNFSAATGIINLDSVKGTANITYNVNSNIQLGTASTGNVLILQGAGSATFNFGGVISELQTGGGSILKSGTSTVALSGINTYTGGTTVSGGTLTAQDGSTASPGSNNFVKALGTGAVTLNGGALSLKANGSGNTQSIITGNGTTGNNVIVTANSTINVSNLTGTNASSTIQFNNLSIGASTLAVTGANSYGVQFAGTTTLTGNATFNPTTASALALSAVTVDNSVLTGTTTTLNLAGNNTGQAVTGIISNNGTDATKVLALNKSAGSASTWTLSGANTYTGATSVLGGALTVSGAAGSINGSSGVTVSGGTLNIDNTTASVDRIKDTATVTLGGTNGSGTLIFTGNGANSSTTETIGGLAFSSGASTLTLSGAGASQLQTIAVGSTGVTRTNSGTALIRGTSLQTAGTNATRLNINGVNGTGLTLVGGGTAAVGTATNGITKTLSIVPYFIGGTAIASNGSSFLTYDTTAGTGGGLRLLASTEYTTLTASYTTPGTAENVTALNGTISTSADVTVNSLLFSTATQTLNGSGGKLIVNSGAIAATTNTEVIGSGFSRLTLGNGTWNEGIITPTSGNTLTINTPVDVTGSGGLTKSGAGTLVLAANNLYSGQTTINQGTIQVGNAGTTGNLGTNTGAVLLNGGGLTFSRTDNVSFTNAFTGLAGTTETITQAVGSGTLSLGTVNGTGITVTNNTATGAAGALTLNQSGSGLTIATVSGASSSQMIFGGDGTGSTTITNRLNSPGQLLRLTAGTLTLAASGSANSSTTNLQVDGGTLASSGDRLATENNTFSMSGGQFLISSASSFGLRFNGANGVNGVATNTSATFTGTQTGGTINIFKGGNALSFNLGSTSATTSTYNLSSGTINAFGAGTDGRVELGADTAGTGKATFNFSGGKLIASGQISGNQGTAARQAFVWTGGTLVTAAYVATNLTSTDGATYSGNVGTLTNNGTGILAPGDIGVAGLTAITGNYVQGASATLAVDLGGTTAGAAFQNGVSGSFDKVTVSGTTNLNGSVSIKILPGFRPASGNTFSVLTSTGAVTAAGGNFQASAQTVSTNEGFSTMTVTTPNGAAGSVVLGGYTVTNQWAGTNANWSDAQGAGSWSSADPTTNAAGALFINTPGTSVNLVNNRTVRNVTFAPATGGFTIAAGGGTLTLDGGTGGAAVISNAIGNNTINAPVAVGSNGVNAGAATGTTLTLGGALSGSGALNVMGPGAVALSADNTNFTGAITLSDAAASTAVPQLTLKNNNALGGASSVTVYGTTTTGSKLTIGDAITITGKTVTLVSNGSIRAYLNVASGTTGTWNGDIVGSGNGTWGLLTDGTMTVGASSTNVINGSGANSGLAIRGAGTGIINSTLNLGSNGVSKTDAGTWTINSNNNTFTGVVSVNTGSVVVSTIADAGIASALGAGTTIGLGQNNSGVTGVGALKFTGASGGASNRILNIQNGASGGGGVIESATVNQMLTLTGNVNASAPASAATLTLQGVGNGVLGGSINNAPLLSLSKLGAGTWTLSGANTYTGTTTVGAGTLSISTVGAGSTAQSLGAGTSVNLGVPGTSSGILKYTGGAAALDKNISALGNGADTILNSGTGLLTLSGTLTKTGTKLTLSGGANGITVSGKITGSTGSSYSTNFNSDLIVNSGTVTLTNASNDYFGPTIVSGGATLKNGTANALPSGSVLTLGEATGNTVGTYDLAGFNQQIAGLTTAGSGTTQTVTNSGASGTNTLTVSNDATTSNTDYTFSGVIQDGASAKTALTKAGSKTLTLTGANTYTGLTTISGGTVVAANASALSTSNVSIGASGTLKVGQGTSSQELDLSGTFTNSGTVTMNIYGNLATQTLNPSSAADFIKFTGADRGIALTGTFNVGNPNNLTNFSGAPGVGDAFELIDWGGISFANRSSTAIFNLPSLSFGYTWDTANILGSSGSQIGYVMVVPEPSRVMLLFLGLAAAAIRRRRA